MCVAVQFSEEDKRATTNVQHRFVQFFFLSFLLFCSPWGKTLCFLSGKSWGTNYEKVPKSAKKCEKLWNDFALLLLPFSFSLKFKCMIGASSNKFSIVRGQHPSPDVKSPWQLRGVKLARNALTSCEMQNVRTIVKPLWPRTPTTPRKTSKNNFRARTAGK